MNNVFEGFKQFFGPLSPPQRAMFAGLVFIIVASVAGLLYWAQQTDYALLFGSLQSDTAQEIITKLDEESVSYKLENGGTAIYVPDDEVHKLRIKLAPVSNTNAAIKGYELFDSNALGMTDFMQQVNKKRALEGELSRSINSLKQVESSRIHLVLPERTPFQETSVEASASVVLRLRVAQQLSKKQVDGITALIAGSVEGLNAGNVIVLDQAGNRLTDGLDNSDMAAGDMHIQLRQKTEAYLTERGQTMLDRVLGAGNSILRVSVEHDFDKLVRESNLVDPESRIVISEQKSSQIDNNENREQVPIDEFTPVSKRGETVVVTTNGNEQTSQTRNYEVNKTKEVFEKTQGEIKHLSASVLINYKQVSETDAEGNQTVVSKPYSPEEIDRFSKVVALALGIQQDRGDQLSIQQIEFHDPMAIEDTQDLMQQPTPWSELIRWALIAITFIVIVLLIRSIKKRSGYEGLTALQPLSQTIPDGAPVSEEEDKLLKSEGEETPDQLKESKTVDDTKLLEGANYNMDSIIDFVDLKPDEAAQVVRALMATDES